MCVIISLKPGYTLPYDQLKNAAHNNPHGYGLILKDVKNQKLQVIKAKEKDFKNGNDPKEIYDLLKDNEDLERFLHLRWKTEGDITEENCQPFCAYSSNKREVFFMHNGTLYDYRPKVGTTRWINGTKVEDTGETSSDSKKFNDEFLSPFLLRFKGENGLADVTDPVAKAIIHKYWGTGDHNRGLIITNDLDPVFINLNKWVTIKDGNQVFMASNDSYFDKLTRGPEFERLKKEEEESRRRFQEERAKSTKQNSDSTHITKLKSILLGDKIQLPINIKELLHDIDIYDPNGISQLKNITALEWDVFIGNNEDGVALLVHLTDEFSTLYDKYQKAIEYIKKLEGKTK